MADERKKSDGGLVALGIGGLAAALLAAYFLTKKPETPPPPPPPGGGGGGGTTGLLCADLCGTCAPACAGGAYTPTRDCPSGTGCCTVAPALRGHQRMDFVADPANVPTRVDWQVGTPFASFAFERIAGTWRHGGGPDATMAVYVDGVRIADTGCIKGDVYQPFDLAIFRVGKVVTFQVECGGCFFCGNASMLLQEIHADAVLVGPLCQPPPPTQTCAAQGGACGSADACIRKGGSYHSIPSTDCLATCCHA